jgi:hypothetical protein
LGFDRAYPQHGQRALQMASQLTLVVESWRIAVTRRLLCPCHGKSATIVVAERELVELSKSPEHKAAQAHARESRFSENRVPNLLVDPAIQQCGREV